MLICCIAEIGTRPREDFVDLSQIEPPSYCLPGEGSTPLSAFYPPNIETHFKVGREIERVCVVVTLSLSLCVCVAGAGVC